MTTTTGGLRRRVAVRVEGTVQGVGFRPYVYRLARELDLSGFVFNDERGVALEVEGEAAAVERFLDQLPAEAPPLATVERISPQELAPTGQTGFRIEQSDRSGEPRAPVTPDTATCAECLAELFDPADRRYRYPFINCTNCGPRFTIVCGVPYDRRLTTMDGFEMCAACSAEYEHALDRRFHAQPNACPACGPTLRLVDRAGDPVEGAWRDAVEGAAAALRAGRIVAVKGLGGFHLACRADDQEVVARLRARKHREDKPFALMVADLHAAHALARLAAEDESLLAARERPIVLAPRHEAAPIAEAVAPGVPELGLMLAYSPLHHLLLADAGTTLVMTSGNASDEPIAYQDADALERLASIADLFLVHDRPIQTRTDDSVVRTVDLGDRRRPLLLRRSRGYVPASIPLPAAAKQPLLACGAELKNTFCLARCEHAWVGHHVGDLENYETLCAFRVGIGHFERLFAVVPQVVAHDLHPDYLSTKYAHEREGVELVGVQHHHAHLAACLAEHGQEGPAVGAIYDGTGYGLDETVWGGEILAGGLAGFERAGHLWPVRLPGGPQAIREPWRMACAWLVEAGGDEDPRLPTTLEGRVDQDRWRAVTRMARTGLGSPSTTSMGRLFDAVAALCGLRVRVNYEGQAAVELEAAAGRFQGNRDAYPLPLVAAPAGGSAGPFLLDARETILAVTADLRRGATAAGVAARFHQTVAKATAESCAAAARRHGLGTVVLSGGVFQNRLLLERSAGLLAATGLRVLTPERLPPNDGGIAYGQAAVAAASSRVRT